LITLIPQQSVQGTIASNIVLIPVGAVQLFVQAIVNAGDITNLGRSLTLCAIWTTDLQHQSHGASCTWQSGPGIDLFGNSAPSLSIPIPANMIGFSAQIASPQLISIGIEMDMTDAYGNSLLTNGPSGTGAGIA
jgi:hypothetical protein